MKRFTAKDVPDLSAKTFFITGANTGLGFEAAKALAGRNARVLLGCRSPEKAEQARAAILQKHGSADVGIVEIDLGKLSSVKQAAAAVAQEPRLDVLINNAGIMIPPYQLTEDGFESQFGVNHLGPFALTALLLDKLRSTPAARPGGPRGSNRHDASRQSVHRRRGVMVAVEPALCRPNGGIVWWQHRRLSLWLR